MEFKDIKLILKDEYLNLYHAKYINNLGEEKIYEIISRSPNLDSNSFLGDKKIDGVGIIAFNEVEDKILLLKEFRMSCGTWVYTFPGGLIDNGEDVLTTAKRELFEETGLELYDVKDILNGAYSIIGVGNEMTSTIICKARGTFKPSTSPNEEIKAGWYSKEEVKKLLRESKISLRTQSVLYFWANS